MITKTGNVTEITLFIFSRCLGIYVNKWANSFQRVDYFHIGAKHASQSDIRD